MIDVAIPEQPQESSSVAMQLSTALNPTPPCSGGMQVLESPISQAFFMISRGNSPDWSYSAATGAISSLAKRRRRW